HSRCPDHGLNYSDRPRSGVWRSHRLAYNGPVTSPRAWRLRRAVRLRAGARQPTVWQGGDMGSLVKGIHHITVCASGAQEDVDFFTKVVGQRMIKQTVLFDGRYAHYHLYYANANAEVGSVYTSFPYKRVPGRVGSGQIQSSAYSVPAGSLTFWHEHLQRHGVPN